MSGLPEYPRTSDREFRCPSTERFRVRLRGGQLSAHREFLVSIDSLPLSGPSAVGDWNDPASGGRKWA